MNLAERLRSATLATPTEPLLEGDHPLAPDIEPIPAAVLIAVTDRPSPGVLLTVRRADLRTHAGQIAFPGGRIDPGENATAAALREAEEEIALDRAAVTVVAELDRYDTITGYSITPVLGTVPPDLPLAAHEFEVADWFEAPLDYLLERRNHRRSSVLFEGRQRHYYEIAWEHRIIWGATAALIVNLARRLAWS